VLGDGSASSASARVDWCARPKRLRGAPARRLGYWAEAAEALGPQPRAARIFSVISSVPTLGPPKAMSPVRVPPATTSRTARSIRVAAASSPKL